MTQPENVYKYCSKCGSNLLHFDGERAFVCGQCGFNFYINSAAAVAGIIVNNSGEILFTFRAHEPYKGYLDLPGGFIDPLESAETALRREILEELNLRVVKMDYLVSFPNEYVFSGLSVYTTDLAFVVTVKDLDNIKAADDITGFEFIAPQNIDFDKIGAHSIVQIVKAYLLKRTVGV
jgi:NAD+ diphosphatase